MKEHAIRNHLQVILWALEPEADEEARLNGRKALESILTLLEGGSDSADK